MVKCCKLKWQPQPIFNAKPIWGLLQQHPTVLSAILSPYMATNMRIPLDVDGIVYIFAD
jgi:hypothetical protein